MRDGLNMIHNEIYGCRVNVKAILARKQVKLKDIMAMNSGDVVPIEMPEHATMYAENVPSFLVKLGKSNDKYALKIMELIKSDGSIKGNTL